MFLLYIFRYSVEHVNKYKLGSRETSYISWLKELVVLNVNL